MLSLPPQVEPYVVNLSQDLELQLQNTVQELNLEVVPPVSIQLLGAPFPGVLYHKGFMLHVGFAAS